MKAEAKDAAALAPMVKRLWPEHDLQALVRILTEYIASPESAVFACREGDRFVGAALCCLRHDYVEGCETSPVGYLEGVYVEESHRLAGTARALVGQCEQWAKSKGCREFASDCELTNKASLAFHLSLGFTEENRIICFKAAPHNGARRFGERF